MTDIVGVVKNGRGKVPAGFLGIPMSSSSVAGVVIEKLKAVGLCNLAIAGKANESVCEIPAKLNKVGLILLGVLDPVVATAETGVDVISRAISSVTDAGRLTSFRDL